MPRHVATLLIVLAFVVRAEPEAATAASPSPAAGLHAEHLEKHRNDIRLRPGDSVRIMLKEDPDVTFTGEVSPAGLVVLPYLGEFKIAGLTAVSAEAVLKAALEDKLYQHATVSVIVTRHAARYIQVYGAVEKPGAVACPMSCRMSLIQAVTEAGGLTTWGAPSRAYLVRAPRNGGTPTRISVDIAEAFQALDGPANIALEPDDVIFVPSAGAVSVLRRTPESAYVYGAVKFPGKRPMPQLGELTVMQAVIESGGLSSWAEPEDAYILRIDDKTGSRKRVPVNVAEALTGADAQHSPALLANDILFVPSKAAGSGAVLSADPLEIIVSGEVTQPGVIRFEPGEQATFVRAIFKAGNFTEFAKSAAVRLIRYNKDGTRMTRKIDASRIMQDGYLEDDFQLEPGDMIIVDEKRLSFR